MEEQTQEIIALLQQNEYLKSLTEEEMKHLASLADIKKFSKNQVVFSVDQTGRYFYMVFSGQFLLKLRDYSTLMYEPGEIFGEVAIFTDGSRKGTITAVENSALVRFDRDQLFDTEITPCSTAFNVVRLLTKKIISYLVGSKQISSEDLIKSGESENVEFKESPSKAGKHVILQTMVAFMNSNGGTIFVGVDDEQKIIGVEAFQDYKERDKYNLSIINMLGQFVGKYYTRLVTLDFQEINGAVILRIDCNKSVGPVFYRGSKDEEAFYIRSGASTQSLEKPSAIYSYISEHFGDWRKAAMFTAKASSFE